MTENEFLLFDRIEKIKQIINEFGEDNFYISFSGGKEVLFYIILWILRYQIIKFLEFL